jgi:hypothetical protein
VRVMNYLTYIYATYKEVKVNEEEEENIVLQVLGEFVCVRLWGSLFSGGVVTREDFLYGGVF